MKTFLLLAGMLLAALMYGQMASVKVTSSDNTMPCSTKILTFDAHDPDGIYSVTVQTKMVWNHQTVYEYKRLPAEAGVVDSSFSVELITNTDRTMEYKVILETKNGLIVPINGIFIQDIPSRVARNPKYANTIKFANYFEDCQPVKVGAKVIPHFVGSCDQYTSSFDTTMVVKPGELVITIWGDDPATPYIDGFQDGDLVTMFDLSDKSYNEFKTKVKFDAKRSMNDTVFSVGESASGLNYWPDFIPYTDEYNFGTVNKPTTKQIVFANTLCNKSLQPKIIDILYTDHNGVHYSHKITSDTTVEMTYDAKGEGISAIQVQYEVFPDSASTAIKEKMFFLEAYSGDYQVNICVKDELGQTIRPQAYQGVDPSDITANAFYNNVLKTGVPDGWTSTVSVTHAKYRMVPSAISINNLNKDTVLNFIAMYDGKLELKTQTIVGNSMINDVTAEPVLYNVNGKIVPSDSIGQYTDSLPARWSGFIVPIVKDYTFDTLKIASLLESRTFQIQGTYTGTYTLSGVCTSAKGPIAGVMVIAGTDTVNTDNQGVFSFQKPIGWSGKLAFSKTDFSFVNPTVDYEVSALIGSRTDFSFYGGESQVYFYDQGIKYRIEHNKNIDTDGDGIIQVREARAFTGSLDFTNLDNPRDYLALSHFENIEVLVLTNSDFSSIDLSLFTHLVGLVAGGSSFEFLDISANSELQFVYTAGSADLTVICGGNPQITYTKDAHTAVSSSCNNLFTQSIKLNTGWNLISINVVPSDNTVKSLFAGLNVLEIKTMEAFWRADQPEMFNSLREIVPGEGYMVNMKTAGELKISGTPLAAINYIRDKSQRWKLIGTPFPSPTGFSELYNMLNCTEIKDFNGFWKFNGATNNMSQFEPGKAYFVK